MKTIWKFPLAIVNWQDVEMPMGATILSVDVQKDILCIWALVDPTRNKVNRRIRIAGTGHEIDPRGLDYIGTAQMAGGDLIWHVFMAE